MKSLCYIRNSEGQAIPHYKDETTSGMWKPCKKTHKIQLEYGKPTPGFLEFQEKLKAGYKFIGLVERNFDSSKAA